MRSLIVVGQVACVHLPEEGMIQDIEELRAELGGHPFLDLKVLGDRKVPSAKWRIKENVPPDGPVLPIGRRDQDGVARDIAASVEQRGRCKGSNSSRLTVAGRITRGGSRTVPS